MYYKYLILICICFNSISFAQIEFSNNEVLSFHSYGANYIDSGDIDGDGDFDIVGCIGNDSSSSIVWFKQNNKLTFNVNIIDTIKEEQFKYSSLIDLDHDKDLDVIVCVSFDAYYWYENNGNGEFEKHILDDTVQIPNPVYTGEKTNKSYLWESSIPKDTFGEPEFFLARHKKLTACDIDKDGDVDLIGASTYLTILYENVGEMIFNKKLFLDINTTTIGCGDMDGDGDIDLVTDKHIYYNDGNLNFAKRFNLFDNNNYLTNGGSNNIVDFDKDGDLDILFINPKSSSFHWLENNDSNGLIEHLIYQGDRLDIHSVTYADVDLDGDFDILGSSNAEYSAFLWLENDNNFEFTKHSLANGSWVNANNLGGNAELLIAKDIDQDGDIDLLGAAPGDNVFSIFVNNGKNDFKGQRIQEIETLAFDTGKVVSGDIDGDGDMDFTTYSGDGHNFSWFENDGKGEFNPHLVHRGWKSLNAQDINLVDLNNDGILDFVGKSFSRNKYWWYDISNPDEVEINELQDFNFTKIFSPQFIDFDNDGDMDFLAISENDRTFEYYENNGQGKFEHTTLSVTMPEYDKTYDLKVIDIDNDGDFDIVTRNTNSNKDKSVLYIFENDGTNNFSFKHISDLPESGPYKYNRFSTPIRVDDFNNDDLIDIIAYDRQNTFLFINFGANVFEKLKTTEFEGGLKAISDINNDGYLDIITSTTNETLLYLGLEKYKFNDKVVVGSGIRSCDFGDFNNDCINDMVVSTGLNEGYAQYSLILKKITNVPKFNTGVKQLNSKKLISQSHCTNYQWYDCNFPNTPLEKETNKTLSPNKKGSYFVQISNGKCYETSDCFFFENNELNTSQYILDTTVKAYPNPSKGSITIESPIKIDNIVLMNLQGQTVSSIKCLNNKSTITNIPDGYYILTISCDRNVINKKIIVR